MLSAKVANLLVVLQISAFALAASPPPPPIPRLNHLNPNITLPQNSSAVSTPNDLPPLYWNYSIPGPGNRQVTFYNYGNPLNPQGLDDVIGLAYGDAISRHHASERMTFPLEYVERGSGTRVMLSWFPGPQTTWGEWANTVVGLEEFAFSWDNIALNFVLNIVGDSGPALGVGSVRNIIVS